MVTFMSESDEHISRNSKGGCLSWEMGTYRSEA